jgi:hypothetical protein
MEILAEQQTTTQKLEAFLKSIPEVTYGMLGDHSGDWVQTSLGISVRTGILRPWRHTSAEVGILDHVGDEYGLRAKLYSESAVISAFPQRKRDYVAEVYQKLVSGVSSLGFKVEELPPEEDLSMYVMMW